MPTRKCLPTQRSGCPNEDRALQLQNLQLETVLHSKETSDMTLTHRNIEWFGLEGNLQISNSNPQGHLPLEQVAQSSLWRPLPNKSTLQSKANSDLPDTL